MTLPGRSQPRLSRRSLLRGVGAAIALPAFESLAPVRASVAAAEPPTRMAVLYVPNGVFMDRWRPVGEGRDFSFGPSLDSLAPFRDRLQLITGLSHQNATPGPDGPGDHARAMATILTGARARKTAGADIRVGISMDQVAANAIGHQTRFPSLELTCDEVRKAGNCDSGYSCAYQFNMSWRSPTQPATPEMNPRAVFERLFGSGSAAERAANLAARQARRRSILDFVAADARDLERRLGTADRRKLDEYLVGVREIERRVAGFDRPVEGVPDLELPDRPPREYRDHFELLADMLVLAFRTDSTRVATFILSHDGSNRTFPEIGVTEAHHEISHHQDRPERLELIAKIDRFYAERLATFLGKLATVPEADGRSLLDHSMILYASGICDGNRHNHDDLPVVLAGGAGGRLATGRHLRLPSERPMSDLFLTMLDLVGAPQERFADSSAPLDELLVNGA
jgi:hypothetical protein